MGQSRNFVVISYLTLFILQMGYSCISSVPKSIPISHGAFYRPIECHRAGPLCPGGVILLGWILVPSIKHHIGNSAPCGVKLQVGFPETSQNILEHAYRLLPCHGIRRCCVNNARKCHRYQRAWQFCANELQWWSGPVTICVHS